MCPLRLILIFLSATLAGFFVLRNLKYQKLPTDDDADVSATAAGDNKVSADSLSSFSKVRFAVESGFWTCVDMASGRYLWRHIAASNKQA